jgi:predicted adenylyl cyclase CyaB
MAVEQEVKIKIDEDKKREITAFLGKPDYFNQINLIYRNNDGFLRLRKEKGNTVITYKGPRRDEILGCREELEVSLPGEEAFSTFKEILGRMGMNNPFFYEKWRAEYSLASCKVCLDSTKVGDFVEIESHYSNRIEKLMQMFGLREEDIEKRNYLELLLEKR